MKTKILSIIAVVLFLTALNSTVFATEKNETVLTEISSFNNVEIRGNVEVYLTNGETDQVKVYNNYYAENALVQNQKGVLRIASYAKDKLIVYITVADLRSLSVYDNAVVKSINNFSSIALDVNLYNNAKAQLNIEAYEASVTTNNNARVYLAGTVQEFTLEQNQSSKVKNTGFVAAHLIKKATNLTAATKEDQDLIII